LQNQQFHDDIWYLRGVTDLINTHEVTFTRYISSIINKITIRDAGRTL